MAYIQNVSGPGGSLNMDKWDKTFKMHYNKVNQQTYDIMPILTFRFQTTQVTFIVIFFCIFLSAVCFINDGGNQIQCKILRLFVCVSS